MKENATIVEFFFIAILIVYSMLSKIILYLN